MYKKISIIGAGTWGTAIANHLASSSEAQINLYHYNPKSLKIIEERMEHPNLSSFKLPSSINFCYSNKIEGDLCIIAVPVQKISITLNKFSVSKEMPILVLSKGIDCKSLELPVDLIKNRGLNSKKIGVLSGPSHAEQVISKTPTSVVVASQDIKFSESIQDLFSNKHFRVYINSDIVGVQIAGAVKNVISIASGIVAGLGYRENTVSAMVTRGLHEIKKLGSALGADRETFNGLAGIGDLMVTSFSEHSRNRRVGINLSKGVDAKKTINQIKMEAEGVYSVKSIIKLSKKLSVEMPICSNVYDIIYCHKKPEIAIKELMLRKLKSEEK